MMGKRLFLCALSHLKQWAIDRRIYMLAALLLAFNVYHFSGIHDFARSVQHGVTPWIFPHLFSHPLVLPVYGCFLILLYCDAPFLNDHTPFVLVRAGRATWILGQFLYIVLAGFLFTLLTWVACILSFLPHIELSADWGVVLRTVAMDGNAIAQRGFQPAVAILDNIIQAFTPLRATLLSLLLLFETAVFLGTLMLCLSVAVNKISGILVSGLLVFTSYFSGFLGKMTLGLKLYYFSPLNWSSLVYLDWSNSGDSPSIVYAVVMLAVLSIALGIVSAVVFCKRDVQFSSGAE